MRRRGGAGEGEPDPGGWAENEGLATLWVGSFDPPLLRGILPGAEGYELVAMINVGYPAPDSKPSAMHGVRKPVGELVTRVK